MHLKTTTSIARALTCSAIIIGLFATLQPATAADPAPGDPKPARNTPEEKKIDDKKPEKESSEVKETKSKMPALEFKMNDINGKAQDLRQYQGNVILMVNVASKCGLTPQYEGLEEVYKKLKDRGFVILGFPANNFLRQEPGTDDDIKAFCKKNYGVTFPMFSKVSVKGKDKCDLYAYLTNKKADHKFGGSIEWNFAKFVIDRDGKIAHRFSPRTAPDDKEFLAAIEKELEKAIPEGSPLARKRAAEEKDKQPAPRPTP